MTDEQKLNISGWNCLSDAKPILSALCEWAFVADTYTEQGMGTYFTGDYHSGFCDYRGIFVSDPTRTYWKKIEQ